MPRKIKVAEVVSRLESGGVESMLLNYLGHFKHPEDFDIHIITQDINDERCVKQFQDAGYTVDIVTHKRKSILKNVIELYRLMHSERFNVVHAHTTLTNFYILWIARLTGAKKLISHSHNSFVSKSKVKQAIWSVLKMLNKASANIWMACGHDAGVFLYGEKAVRSGKVQILNNAIELEKYAFNPEARDRIRREYNIGKTDYVIGHVGRFMKQKNHKYLIDIFAEFNNRVPNSYLLLLGTGELEDEIHHYVNDRGLSDRVIFTGSVANVGDFYSAMDVFVLPSLYEGFPVVSIEVQAAGLPLYASDNIDRSIDVAQGAHFLSAKKEPLHWANEILKEGVSTRYLKNIEALRAACYDINIEASSLENLYRNMDR